jgi:glycosyltransferase involved in cell wall biosynthesis
MSIGLISNAWPGTSVGRYIFEIFDYFKKWKKDVDMIFLESIVKLTNKDKQIKILKTPFKLPFGTAGFNNYFYFPKKIPKGYDLYHISNERITKCCENNKPSIVTHHGYVTPYILKTEFNMITRLFLNLQNKNLKHAERIITISQNMKKDIVKYLKIQPQKVDVVYLGVDHKNFRPRDKKKVRKKLSLDEDKKIILHVGTDVPRKNIKTILEAVNILKGKIDFQFVRIGGPLYTSRDLLHRLNLESYVHEIGPVEGKLVSLYYNAADVFVFPSIYEGFGLPLVEAMASGTPVIASNINCIPEITGGNAILSHPFDVKSLSKNILEVLSNESLAKEMKRRGIKRSKEFTWKKTAKETLRIYEQVLR